ncbi:MFS transporter [soil metagenome]
MAGEPETAGAAPNDWNYSATVGLSFLTLISSINYLDRSLLGLALPAIKAEMHVTDTVLGLVSGLAFLLFYSLLGVPIAWAADRWSRRNIIAIGLAFWSLMTLATGWVANIWQLALTRFLMGAGEACGIAPSNSMLGDLFTEKRRPLAMSIFGAAVSVSSILFFPLMGWIGQHYGWRRMFFAAGLPGLALALFFVLVVREPVRGQSERVAVSAGRESVATTIRFLAGSRSYLALVAAATFMGLNVFAAGIWIPTFLQRVHGMSLAETAALIGPLRGVFGFAGVVLGGLTIDRLMRRNSHWRATVPAIACFLVVPVELAFLLSNSRAVWVAAFAASAFLVLVHQGPLFAMVMSIARVRMRAVAISLLVLCSALLGQASGPLIIGALNDRLTPTLGENAIRFSLLVIVASAFAAGVCLLVAGRYVERDMARARGDVE